MIDSLVNKPNLVLQKQRMLQADTRPVYQRGARSALYFRVYMGIFSLGMLGTATGLYGAIAGKKVE